MDHASGNVVVSKLRAHGTLINCRRLRWEYGVNQKQFTRAVKQNNQNERTLPMPRGRLPSFAEFYPGRASPAMSTQFMCENRSAQGYLEFGADPAISTHFVTCNRAPGVA